MKEVEMAYKVDFRLVKYKQNIIGMKQRRESANVFIVNATEFKYGSHSGPMWQFNLFSLM